MSVNNNKIVLFLRKNISYIIFILCLAVITAVVVALVVKSNSQKFNFGEVVENLEKEKDIKEENDNKDVTNIIVFDMPLENSTVIKNYVDNSVVYNQTLDLYTGHKAIDFAGIEGASVKSCFNGVVKSIEENKVNGITLTIDHGNGLYSLYNGIEVVDDIEVGSEIDKGEIIGVLSNNNKSEYKDGAHLHFEVLEDGKKVNPNKYLLVEEK